MDIAEGVLFAAYLLVGPLCWAALSFFTVKSRRRMRLRAGADAVSADALPRVTVMVPARNEVGRIGACLRAVLGQDYPNLEVVAVDDRSTDRTAELIAAAAAGDRRVRAVRVAPADPPGDWCGKNFALHVASSHATGQWLAFIDADVTLAPGALRTAVALSVAKRYDVASFLPRTGEQRFPQRLADPLFGAFVLGVHGAALTNHDGHRDVAFANGQFMLLTRATYDAIGGHAAVADRCCEDVALARRAKAMGRRVRLLIGTELGTVAPYRSLPAALRGWGRILYVIDPGRPWRTLLAVAFLLACCLSAYGVAAASLAGVARGNAGAAAWLAAATCHLGLMTSVVGLVYRWGGMSPRNALWLPLAIPLLLAVFVAALWHCATGVVEWRGTRYTQNTSLRARLADLFAHVAGPRREPPVAAPTEPAVGLNWRAPGK